MLQDNLNSDPSAQALRDSLRQIQRPSLPACASKRNHQILKPTLLIVVHACIHQRHDAGQKLMHALLLVEVVDHRCVSALEQLEALFAPGIWQAAPIEDDPAAVPALILRQAAMKRKAC